MQTLITIILGTLALLIIVPVVIKILGFLLTLAPFLTAGVFLAGIYLCYKSIES